MTIIHQAYPGDTFHECAQDAIRKATTYQDTVTMMFNEIPVSFTVSTTIEQAWESYSQAVDERARIYKESAEGKAAEQRATESLRRHQESHDECMRTLPTVLEEGEAAILDWLVKFSQASDHVGVMGRDFARVSSLLELYGYVEGDCLGLDKNEYRNPRIMARYIVGQALTCMKSMGMGPHPVTEKFVADYHNLIK